MKIFTHSFNSGKNAPNIPPGVDHLARSFLWVFGCAAVLVIAFLGISKASQALLPYLVPFANLLIAIFVFVIYPLSFIKKARASLKILAYLMSYLLGACAWIYSLLFVITTLGFWGIFFCFLFQTLTPITILGAIFKGTWDVVGTLFFWLISSYLIRFFSLTLGFNHAVQGDKKSKIIDVEAHLRE